MADADLLSRWYAEHLGIEVEVDPELYPNGRFAQLTDPEGNAVQLWEPLQP